MQGEKKTYTGHQFEDDDKVVQLEQLNCVSCFNAGHIFVDIFMIMHCTVMKFGVNIEAKHINDL